MFKLLPRHIRIHSIKMYGAETVEVVQTGCMMVLLHTVCPLGPPEGATPS